MEINPPIKGIFFGGSASMLVETVAYLVAENVGCARDNYLIGFNHDPEIIGWKGGSETFSTVSVSCKNLFKKFWLMEQGDVFITLEGTKIERNDP